MAGVLTTRTGSTMGKIFREAARRSARGALRLTARDTWWLAVIAILPFVTATIGAVWFPPDPGRQTIYKGDYRSQIVVQRNLCVTSVYCANPGNYEYQSGLSILREVHRGIGAGRLAVSRYYECVLESLRYARCHQRRLAVAVLSRRL